MSLPQTILELSVLSPAQRVQDLRMSREEQEMIDYAADPFVLRSHYGEWIDFAQDDVRQKTNEGSSESSRRAKPLQPS